MVSEDSHAMPKHTASVSEGRDPAHRETGAQPNPDRVQNTIGTSPTPSNASKNKTTIWKLYKSRIRGLLQVSGLAMVGTTFVVLGKFYWEFWIIGLLWLTYALMRLIEVLTRVLEE